MFHSEQQKSFTFNEKKSSAKEEEEEKKPHRLFLSGDLVRQRYVVKITDENRR